MKRWAQWLGISALVYLAVSLTVYAFRHPEQTDTQRLLNILEALRWK